MDTVVVGVDGSSGSRVALAEAVREATMRGARLRVVAAWDVVSAGAGSGFAPGVDPATIDTFRHAAEEAAREAVAEVGRLAPELACDGEAVPGHAAEVLLREGAGAALVVLGHRGRGGLASLVLGSVGQQVLHHAPCLVLVVPAPR